MSAGAPDATAAVNVCYNEPFVISIYLYQLQQGTNQNPIFFFSFLKDQVWLDFQVLSLYTNDSI